MNFGIQINQNKEWHFTVPRKATRFGQYTSQEQSNRNKQPV